MWARISSGRDGIKEMEMHRFEDGTGGADVAARREPEAADETRAQVRQDVAVQVRHDEHVVRVRVAHNLLEHTRGTVQYSNSSTHAQSVQSHLRDEYCTRWTVAMDEYECRERIVYILILSRTFRQTVSK